MHNRWASCARQRQIIDGKLALFLGQRDPAREGSSLSGKLRSSPRVVNDGLSALPAGSSRCAITGIVLGPTPNGPCLLGRSNFTIHLILARDLDNVFAIAEKSTHTRPPHHRVVGTVSPAVGMTAIPHRERETLNKRLIGKY